MDTEKKKMNGLLEQEKRDNQAALKQAGTDNAQTLQQQKTSHQEALGKANEDAANIISNQVAKDKTDQSNAEQHAETMLAAERTKRDRLQAQKERFAAILIPLAVAAAAIWIGLLTYGNARRRQSEIGILRAIGLRTSQILTLLLGKAFYLGLLGGLMGVGAGLALGLGLCETTLGQAQARQLIEPNNLMLAAALAPVIAMLGSWLPAIAAARQDPAMILQEE